MPDPQPLNYARPSTAPPGWSAAAIIAFLVGILVTPIAYGFARTLKRIAPFPPTKIFVIVHVILMGYCALTYLRLRRSAPPLRGQDWAMAGLVFACFCTFASFLIADDLF
jgi:hypothetical protein